MNSGDELIRDQLGAMEQGTGKIPFDKEAGWERLHQRLQPEQKKKIVFKPVYRWTAAAILLVAVAIAMLYPNNNEPAIVVEQPSVPVQTTIPTQHEKDVLPVLNTNHTITKKGTISQLSKQAVTITAPTITLPNINETKSTIQPNKTARLIKNMKVVHISDVKDIEEQLREMKDLHYVIEQNNDYDHPADITNTLQHRNQKHLRINFSTQN